MRCPLCGGSSKIEETRPGQVGAAGAVSAGQTRRYRRCERCRQRFTTVESVDVGSVAVTKRDGAQQTFSRAKLSASIRKATPRSTAPAELAALTDAVVQRLVLRLYSERAADDRTALTSEEIGREVLEVLGDDPANEAVMIRYALLFEPAWGGFHDAVTFLRWLAKQRLSRGPAAKAGEAPTWVVKRNGAVVPFDSAKLARSVRFASKKRPPEEAQDDDHRLGEQVAAKVLEAVRYQATVTTGQLSSEVLALLRSVDSVAPDHLGAGEQQLAYLRAASTAKAFTRAEDFKAEARGLIAHQQE